MLAPAGKWMMIGVITAVALLTMPVLMNDHTPWRQIVLGVGCSSLFISLFWGLIPNAQWPHGFWTITFYFCTQIYVFPCFWLFAISWVPWLFWFIWITKDRPWRTQAFWAEITCIANFFSYTIYQILLE
jgi:hypothetical protein